MMEMVEQHIRREAEALEEQRQGSVAITVGKVLLWVDLLLACFVCVGLRAGSYLFLCWVLSEALLGLVLLGVGFQKRAAARRKLAELAPR